jgi:TPR repeat protein
MHYRRIFKILLLSVLLLPIHLYAQSAMYLKATKLYNQKQYKEAFKLYEIMAKDNDHTALFSLGLMYSKGLGVPQNYLKAVDFYKRAILHGNTFAASNLGYLFATGTGVKKDLKKAFILYKFAAEKGNTKAQRSIATMYYLGRGVKQNYQEALKWLRKTAEQGEAKEQFWFGYAHLKGLGTEKNNEIALKWLNLSAKQGFDKAQYVLGLMYFNGQGVKKDRKSGISLLKKAAQQGFAAAQNDLAYYWAVNNKNLDKAENLIKKVIKQNPNNPHGIDTMGYVFYKQGKFNDAIEQFRKALKLRKSSVILEHLGDAYFKINDINKARSSWLEALKLKDDDWIGALKLTKDEKLKSSIKNKLDELNKKHGNHTHP